MGVLQNFQKVRYGCGSVTELPEVPGIAVWANGTRRSSGYGYESLTELPGIVARAYRTSRSSGYE